MVTGQTVANMLGVPAGTLMAEFLSWRLAFGILAAWAAMTIVLASGVDSRTLRRLRTPASPVSSSSSPAVARG